MRFPVGSYVRVRKLDHTDDLYSWGAQDFVGRVGRVLSRKGICHTLGDFSRPRTRITAFWPTNENDQYELYDDDLEPSTREAWEAQQVLDAIER